jgi:LPXTG-motif cell wall-anchored protein
VTFTVVVGVVGAAGRSGYRAAVAPSIDGGSVTISDGDTVIAVVALDRGRATHATSALTQGTHVITAAFGGTATAAASSGTLVQRVDGGAPSPSTRSLLPATGSSTSTLVVLIALALLALGRALIAKTTARARDR